MPAGRPPKWKNVKELQEQIDAYFASVPEEEWMITGLAVHLDTSRETLCNYEEKDEFFDTIKRAKHKVEMAYEKRGMQTRSAFDIFRLKNMGWKDKQELDHTTAGEKIQHNPLGFDLAKKYEEELKKEIKGE